MPSQQASFISQHKLNKCQGNKLETTLDEIGGNVPNGPSSIYISLTLKLIPSNLPNTSNSLPLLLSLTRAHSQRLLCSFSLLCLPSPSARSQSLAQRAADRLLADDHRDHHHLPFSPSSLQRRQPPPFAGALFYAPSFVPIKASVTPTDVRRHLVAVQRCPIGPAFFFTP